MTIIALVPLVIAILGLVMYFASSNPKVQEVGRLMFAAGLLIFCYSMTATHVRIG